MPEFIEARVIQKSDTLSNWNNNPLPLYSGEQAFVVDNNGVPYAFKLGAGSPNGTTPGKRFSELPWPDYTVKGSATPSTTWNSSTPPGVYIPLENGVYGNQTVNLSDGYQVLYWSGSGNPVKVVFPIDLGGYVSDAEKDEPNGVAGLDASGLLSQAVMGRLVTTIETSGLDDAKTAGLYRVNGTNPYFMEVSGSGNNIRQYRLFGNISGPEPTVRFRNWNGTSWSAWADLTVGGPIRIGSQVNYDDIVTPGVYYRPNNATIPVMLWVATDGTNVRQMRLYTSSANFVFQYRNRVSGTWSPWVDIISEQTVTNWAGNNDTLFEPGIYYVSGNANIPYLLWVNVDSVSGEVKQLRLYPRYGANSVFEQRRYVGGVWGSWESLLSGGSSSSSLTEDSVENMIWSWWNYPTLKRTNSRAFDKFYLSYTDQFGNTGVAQKNSISDTVTKTKVKEVVTDVDDHNGGGVVMLPGGRLVTAFASGHNVNNLMYVHRSVNTEDGTKWGPAIQVAASSGKVTTYCQLIQNGNTIRMFFRTLESGTTWRWEMSVSTDGGATWSAPQTILNAGSTQWYAIFRPTTDSNLIKFAHYSNPTQGNTNIRGGLINVSTGDIYDADGITVRGQVGQENAVSGWDILVPQGTSRNRIMDLGVSAPTDFQILYCTFTNQNDGVYMHYNNGVDISIVAAGKAFYTPSRYYGGAVFGAANQVFLSRFDTLDSNWKVELYELSGGAYSMSETVRQTSKVAIRPQYDDGVLVWHEGVYNSSDFTDFQTQMSFKYYE